MANRTMDVASPNRVQGPLLSLPLVRQGSLYNRTFDEVQSQLGNTGKPMYSMTLVELLKNVISAESRQLVQNPSSSSSSSSASFFLGNGNINLNGTLSNKTIYEVWREIVPHEHVNRVDNNHLQQPSLGETTLEDFLVRAGVTDIGNQDHNTIADARPLMAIDPMAMVSQQEDWLPLQMQMQMPAAIHIHQQQQRQQQQHQQIRGLCPDFNVSKSVYENPVMETRYSDNTMAISMPMAAMSSRHDSDSHAAAALERKRGYSDNMQEKTIERRQKRMVKNRESAARSRARKQAYTNRLENEKIRLQKTNSWLKKLKEVEEELFSATTLVPRYQLRRTSSATF